MSETMIYFDFKWSPFWAKYLKETFTSLSQILVQIPQKQNWIVKCKALTD